LLPGLDEARAVNEVSLEELEDRPPTDATHAALWQEWSGREEDFYLRCHEWVRALDRESFEALVQGAELGAEYGERLGGLQSAHHTMLHPELPERLLPNPEMGSTETPDGVLVRAYSRYEPLLLTRDLFEVVRAFTGGETVAEVRARLLRDSDLTIPDELLISLHQFRVLVTPAEAAAP
jgi:hypothetical protein